MITKTKNNKIILNSMTRCAFPVTNFPRVLRKVSKHCRKHEDDVEIFDPFKRAWFDGSYQDDDEMRSIENYEEYIESLESSDGLGYPDYVKVSFVNDQVNHGVFATREISKGEFIGVYSGEIGFGDYHEKDASSYLFEMLDDIVYVDAKNGGNFTRYINHTTPENCNVMSLLYLMETSRFGRVFTIPIIILYANESIQAGEQLLYDYGNDYWDVLGVNPKAITPQTYTLN